jgi:hypothetical protein
MQGFHKRFVYRVDKRRTSPMYLGALGKILELGLIFF